MKRVVLILSLAFLACSTSSLVGGECKEGTRASNGHCVPVVVLTLDDDPDAVDAGRP